MTKAEELLKALTDEAAIDQRDNWHDCAYCGVSVTWPEDLEHIEYHKLKCPWRLAKEHLQEKESADQRQEDSDEFNHERMASCGDGIAQAEIESRIGR
jgi:hypothetical protein